MTTLLIIIAVVFIALCVVAPMIDEHKEREFNKWAQKAYCEFDVGLPLFKEYCKFARELRGDKDVAHNAYLIAAEEWYDLNCK